jgi:hypothetical protein
VAESESKSTNAQNLTETHQYETYLPKIKFEKREGDHLQGNKEAYGALVDVVVEASMKMLKSTENLPAGQRLSSFKVVAGHTKRRRSKQKDVETEPKVYDDEKSDKMAGAGIKLSAKPSSECVASSKPDIVLESEITASNSRSHSKPEARKAKEKQSFEDTLSQLPTQSNLNVVQDWIEKSRPPQSLKGSSQPPAYKSAKILKSKTVPGTKANPFSLSKIPKPKVSSRKSTPRSKHGLTDNNDLKLNKSKQSKLTREVILYPLYPLLSLNPCVFMALKSVNVWIIQL